MILERLKDKKRGLKEQVLKELEIKDFEEVEDILDSDRMPIAELGVSKRMVNALKLRKVETVGELRKLRKKDIDHFYGTVRRGWKTHPMWSSWSIKARQSWKGKQMWWFTTVSARS